MPDSLIVVGVDVGGSKKGFHAVALKDRKYLCRKSSRDPAEIVGWCREKRARYIGVDAPCGWRLDKSTLRCAERQLRSRGISSFPTPTPEGAATTPFHYWMLCGEALFRALSSEYPLFDGNSRPKPDPTCFETFPQAVACALAGKTVSAKGSEKRTVRRELLEKFEVELSELRNIDWLDAALCALTADFFARGRVTAYGDAITGFIVVPNLQQIPEDSGL